MTTSMRTPTPKSRIASVLVLLALAGGLSAAGRPNVLVILADDQGWGDLSVNGNRNLQTPRIDSLARDGVVCDRFYVCPVCSPTRAEFLTGRYHPRGGVYGTSRGGERLDLDEQTIAEVFRGAGYATAVFGKWHNGMQYPYHPNGRGFDEFYGFCSGHWGNYFSPPLEHNGELTQGRGYLTDDFTDHALAFMETQVRAGKPFFTYVAYNVPHAPMQVPDRYWRDFAARPLAMRHREPQREDVAFTRAALAMVACLDWNVGRLLDRLASLGIADDTVVVYFSDNGPNSWRWNGGMRGRKGSTDEGGVRAPLLVRWPGQVPAGRHVAPVCGAIDLLPTLADLAGIRWTPPQALDGRSLMSLLRGGEETWPERLLFSHWGGRVSVRDGRFRLDHQGRLYDLEQDPGQATDVSAGFPVVRERLQAAVGRWRREVLRDLGRHDDRPLIVGHPDCVMTQLPARDATPQGGIQRSNRWPNDSFLTHWTALEDAITWPVDVAAAGEFETALYYTCPAADVGARFALSGCGGRLEGRIVEAHDPPLRGAEHDRVPRTESYVKDFRRLDLGRIRLEAGTGTLRLQALTIPHGQVMDFRLLILRRVAPR